MAQDTVAAGILCAMDIELADLRKALSECEIHEEYGYKFYRGKISGVDIVLVQCGVGKVNAARGTQLMIDRYHPAQLVNSGIAGGTADGLHVGDIVIGTSFVQHDFDISAFGYAKGYMCTGIESDKPTVYHADENVVAALERASEKLKGDRHVLRGRIASGDQFIASAEKKAEIAGLFQATAAEMEGAAIAQTAEYAGVPYAVLRVISDLANGEAPDSYETFEKAAADLSAAIICEFIAQLA